MSVFVTDGDQRATLAVVRALGQAGIAVTVGHTVPVSLAASSRYCAGAVCYPSPWEDGERFRAFLHAEMLSGRYRVLLPMTDVTTRLVARARKFLGPSVSVPFPEEEQIELAQDKRRMHLLAVRVGIAIPETFMMHEGECLEDVARKIRYPAVIKPRFSRFLCDGKWVGGTVQYARDPDDLIVKYQKAHAQIPHPLVQEKIEGEGRGVYLLVWDGQVKAAFCHRRLREKPPWGGGSVYCESLPLDEELMHKSSALLKSIGWQGVAMVEFKVDRRDGQAKLMEVNGRFWGSLQLSIDAGLNFPLMLYRLAIGDTVPAQFHYRVGVKSRWLLGDWDHLLIRLSDPHGPNGLSTQSVSRLRACMNFLKFYERDLHYEIFRFDDPRPGWFELKSYTRDVWRHLGRRLRRVRGR